MIKLKIYNLVLLVLILFMICSCTNIRKSAGVTRKVPDEFQAVENPPLVIPPDFILVPPEQLKQNKIENIEKDLAKEILFGLNEEDSFIENQLSTMNQILSKANANNVSDKIRNEINEDIANEMNTDSFLPVEWENEIEVLDAVKESERIREKRFNNESIADGEVPIKKEKGINKKKRFIFF